MQLKTSAPYTIFLRPGIIWFERLTPWTGFVSDDFVIEAVNEWFEDHEQTLFLEGINEIWTPMKKACKTSRWLCWNCKDLMKVDFCILFSLPILLNPLVKLSKMAEALIHKRLLTHDQEQLGWMRYLTHSMYRLYQKCNIYQDGEPCCK